jgi:hypothetical protein
VPDTSTETSSEAPDDESAGGESTSYTVASGTSTPVDDPGPLDEAPTEADESNADAELAVSTIITGSPGSTPEAGSWPALSAIPTTASPAEIDRVPVTSPVTRREPAGMVTAARLPDNSDASDTGIGTTPPVTATLA